MRRANCPASLFPAGKGRTAPERVESSKMAQSTPAQQGGSTSPAQQGHQQQGSGKPIPQQQGGTPVFKDWAAI